MTPRPFPCYLLPRYQNESSYKRFYVEVSLIFIEINAQVKHILDEWFYNEG